MTEPLDTRVWAIEDGSATGKPEAGEQLRRQPVRVILRDLLRPTRVWERALLLWKALASFTVALSAMIAVIVVAMLLIQELTERTVAIEPISVPKELADKGYAPDVAARRLRDAVNRFVARAQTSMKGPEIALRGDVPDIVVPTVGISIDSIATAMRGFLHSNRHRSISGEFTIADGQLWLRLRLDGRQFYSSKTGGTAERPDELLAAAVPQLFKEVQPFIAASYLYTYKRDSAQALKIAQRVIASLPTPDEDVVNSYIMESSIFGDRKSYFEGSAAAMEAIRLAPRFAPAYGSLGNVLHKQHKFDDAMAEYHKVLQLDSNQSFAHANIGLILHTRHKNEEAAKEFRTAITLDPAVGGYRVELGTILREERKEDAAVAELDGAIALFQDKIEQDPDNATTHGNLGDALYSQRKLDDAAAEYRAAINLEPTLPDGHIGLGNVLDRQHKFDAADGGLSFRLLWQGDETAPRPDSAVSTTPRAIRDLDVPPAFEPREHHKRFAVPLGLYA